MTLRYLSCLLLIILVAFSCKNDPASHASSPTGTTPVILPQDTLTRLIVAINDLQVRAEAGKEHEVLVTLKEKTMLESTGKISPHKTKTTIRGIVRDEPWLEVKTPDGKQGWVFGGGLKVEGSSETPVAKILRKERLTTMFGAAKARQILQYRTDFYAAENSRDMENVYIRGTILRDSLTGPLSGKVKIMDYKKLPELSWLEDAMPGHTLRMVAEGTTYYLFQDYKKLMNSAKRTTGEEDDVFFKFMTEVHPFDSVEHFFPVWFTQNWDYGGYSRLGTGVHLEMLRKMNTLMESQQLFRNPVLKGKMRLLEDILINPEKQYGKSAADIQKEIDDILTADLAILSAGEKNSLMQRKAVFDNPKATGITVGMEQ